MDLKYWAATDVGRKRTHNEDNFLVDPDLKLFIVADGMGGHASGEVASAMAVHTIRDLIWRERELFDQPEEEDPTWHMQVCMLLEYAVHIACESIFRKGSQEPEKKGMGTTVVVLLIAGDRGYIAYVGDSRIYLLRGGIVYQLTEDHSLMNELIRQGKITAEDFDDSPYAQFRHAMTRAVGPQEMVEVDTLDFDMIPGDAFLLCSDGLYEYVDDNDIARMLALPEVREIPGRLIDMANTRGGKDNITALVIQVPEDGGSDRAAEINFTLDTLKNIPLFQQLTYQQLVRIMNLTRIVPFSAGDVLCEQGELADELFVILRGVVDLNIGGTSVAELRDGSHFGEMALIDATPRSATATALTEGKLLLISRADFFEILRKEAPLAVKLLWAFVQELSSRLRQTNRDLSVARGEDIVDLSDELAAEDSDDQLDRATVLAELAAVEARLAAEAAQADAPRRIVEPLGRTSAPRPLTPIEIDASELEPAGDERDEDTVRETPRTLSEPTPVTPRAAHDALTVPERAAFDRQADAPVAPVRVNSGAGPVPVAPPPPIIPPPIIPPPIVGRPISTPTPAAPPVLGSSTTSGSRPRDPLPGIRDDDDDFHLRPTRPIDITDPE